MLLARGSATCSFEHTPWLVFGRMMKRARLHATLLQRLFRHESLTRQTALSFYCTGRDTPLHSACARRRAVLARVLAAFALTLLGCAVQMQAAMLRPRKLY
jgi:hypothetical protein